MDHFEFLRESMTSLRIWYKHKDQFSGLLIIIYLTFISSYEPEYLQ